MLLTRRTMLLKTALGLATLAGGAIVPRVNASTNPIPTPGFSPGDDAFLEELEQASFRLFWERTHPETGMMMNRAHHAEPSEAAISSIAATGFGLSGLCIADKREWLAPGAALERARVTLRFLWNTMPHEHGFFYHFVDWRTGERYGHSEVSSIDTAILLCGVLTCRQYFQDDEIRRIATDIYDRVDWKWMSQGSPLVYHGWTPENGFLASRWDTYCEHMMLYLLAIGASRNPIPSNSWDAWQRPQIEYSGTRFIDPGAPLFIHQYSHAWLDFRNRRDAYADYFENSVLATKAHRQFCADLRSEFPSFSEELWGITASASIHGYAVWGGPPRQGPIDGTVVPCAAGGSLPFLPQECVALLRHVRDQYSDTVWQPYGFADSFNPTTGWVASSQISINTGITLLMAENARTGFVWNTFMKNPEVQFAMKSVGFTTPNVASK